jgi:phage-related minor tail protein
MPKEKKIIGTGVKQKALSAEEKKKKEEKEKKEKERERKERKAREAADRNFGLKNKNISSKVQEQIARNVAHAPATPEARRAQAEARAREKKKAKEAEMQAKRELDILMGVISDVSIGKKKTDEEEDEEPKTKKELEALEEEKRRKIEEKQKLLKELEKKQLEMQRQELLQTGVKLKPGDEGYDPYEDYPDENVLGGDFEDLEERASLFKRLTAAVCGLGKKGEVRDAVGKILNEENDGQGEGEGEKEEEGEN